MSNKKYEIDIPLDLLEPIIGLSQEGFAIASIEVCEEGENPSLKIGIARTPILSVSGLETITIPQIPIHSFSGGEASICWSSVETIGDIIDDR